VRILSFGRLPPERIDYLMAYGCAPGREAWVLQQAPATVLQLEGTELALEEDLARQILVTIVAAPKRRRRRWRWRVGRRRGRRRR
jgi:Fe2+ transport system protein FeoA